MCDCGACFTRNDLLRRHKKLAHTNDSEHSLQVISTDLSRKTGLVDLPVIGACHGQASADIDQQTAEGLSKIISQQPLVENYVQDRVYADDLGAHIIDDIDFASSRIDFEKLIRSVGLDIDWFESNLVVPAAEAIQQEDMILEHEDLQISTASATEEKSNGPMPFASRILNCSKDMGFNQGE